MSLAALSGSRALAQGNSPLREARFEVVSSSSLFRGVNAVDVQAAGRVWMVELARRRGFRVDSNIVIATNYDQLKRAIADSGTCLILCDSVEYLRLAASKLVTPQFTIAADKDRPSVWYSLVVRRDAGIGKLEDLRQKVVIRYSRTDSNLAAMWLDVLLSERRVGRSSHFFASVGQADKPTAACLPVFFKKADACVIDNISLELLKELNPQLASTLQVIATSPPLVENVVGVHESLAALQSDFVQAMGELHLDPAGKQVLTLFKGQRIMPLTNLDLTGVRELWNSFLKIEPGAISGSRSVMERGIDR